MHLFEKLGFCVSLLYSSCYSYLCSYCVKTLTEHKEWIRCVRPNADGTMLASCSNDQTVRIWTIDARECKPANVLMGHEHVVECVAWLNHSQGAATIFSGDSDSTVSSTVVVNGDSEISQSGDFPAPLILASGSRDRAICIWDVRAGVCLFTLVSCFSFFD